MDETYQMPGQYGAITPHYSFSLYHYVNLTDGSTGIPKFDLYKFMNIKHLYTWIKEKQIFMNRINEWDDPYENWYFKCPCKIDGIPVDRTDMLRGAFGQCWSTKEETDAMWRIYSYNTDGVRIKTTTEKLVKAIYVNDSSMSTVWLGKVNYVGDNEMFNAANGHSFREFYPESFFYKRKEFKHENEFRIVQTFDTERTKELSQYKFISYNVDVDDFIEEIRFDPRINKDDFEYGKKKLIALGIDPNKIAKSTLYDFNFPVLDIQF